MTDVNRIIKSFDGDYNMMEVKVNVFYGDNKTEIITKIKIHFMEIIRLKQILY